MTEDQNTQPKWVNDLKEWGIDVEAFDARWEKAGTDAQAQFQEVLANAQAEYESDKSNFEAKVNEFREDVGEFVAQMNTAWDEMVTSIMQELKPATEAPEAIDTEDNATSDTEG
ncbi:MAG: hypothetical protein AAFU54_27450 [Chloroflexota bacterium]